MPAKTFRERVAVLKGLRDYCVLAATDGRKCCDECASGWEQRVEALDAVLALCEDGGTPDAWRNDPKVKAARVRLNHVILNLILKTETSATAEDAALDALCAAVAAASGGARDSGAVDFTREPQDGDCERMVAAWGPSKPKVRCSRRAVHEVNGERLCSQHAAMSPSPEPTK